MLVIISWLHCTVQHSFESFHLHAVISVECVGIQIGVTHEVETFEWVAEAELCLWENHNQVVRCSVLCPPRFCHCAHFLIQSVDSAIAFMQVHMDLAVFNRAIYASIWIVNETIVIQSVHLEDCGIQELRLVELLKYAPHCPRICWFFKSLDRISLQIGEYV